MQLRLRFLLLVAPVLAACGVSSTESSGVGDVDRGALGKADLVGSCEHKGNTFCGGKGKGNCWCDEACVEYGDCCSDAEEVCGIEPPPPEGDNCGGIAGIPCDEGEFCMFQPEQMCGAADQMGECVVQPDACIKIFKPVCGCDGKTYGNSCEAAASGASVLHDGACDEPEPQFCGGFGNFPCPEGLTCIDDPDDSCDPNNGGADCGGICVPAPECEPVLCEIFCENGFEVDENGCEICSCAPVFDTCGPIVNDFLTEVAEIQSCQSDDQCGQVLAGTSCGCTNNWVARLDADLSDYEEIRAKAEANACSLPGTISTCDCPAADGFACVDGTCGWNYING